MEDEEYNKEARMELREIGSPGLQGELEGAWVRDEGLTWTVKDMDRRLR